MSNSLTKGVIDKIVSKFLNNLKIRLQAKENEFTYDEKAINKIRSNSFDVIYDARPIRGYI